MKSLVKLREKQLSNGAKSLYLDYNINGRRKYEYLGLYVNKGNDARTKALNRTAYETASTIQARRIVELQEGMAGIERRKACPFFSDYFAGWMDEHRDSYAERTNARRSTVLASWKKFVGGKDYKLDEITPDVMRAYIASLTQSSSTRNVYLKCISTFLGRAMREGYIHTNPCSSLEASEIPKRDTHIRQYLTLEELSIFASTPYEGKYPEMKNAFMFSCFTGLRMSDISTMTWDMIRDGCVIKRQVKTKEVVRIPLSPNAMDWLPDGAHDPGDKVFEFLPLTRHLDKWVEATGIRKHITFHCARHTFATLLITYGTDIYTVSKLLGHTNIATTQIYAKVLDQKKAEAVNMIPRL